MQLHSLLVVAIVTLFSSTLSALPRAAPVPGGLVHIALGQGSQKPTAYYNNLPVLVTRSKEGAWVALVGIDILANPGEHQITVEYKTDDDHAENVEKKMILFSLQSHAYPTERFKIKEKKFDEASPEILDKIKRDGIALEKAFLQFDAQNENLSFIPPVKGKLVENYGHRRVINDIPKAPHKGIDIKAPQGTKVVAVSKGRVTLTQSLFFSGNTVVVDHGQGLQTLYCHLHEINVKEGQLVAQGQLLGTVGKTGRASGPHLHFGVSLNNARIDPLLWLKANS